MQSARLVGLTIAEMLLGIAGAHCTAAKIRVQGPVNSVRLEARGATVAEILAELGEHYAVRYRGTPASNDVTASFEGPLRRVLVRVLQGNDYVIKSVNGGLEVIVLSPGSPTSPAVPAAIVPQTDPFMGK